ncbi:amidohydrolase family protein [Streptomyces sp. RKAG293]|uniref:metal-dependent hydrolase family protein n=1 Tax=Streptomyces sp. RKAG293 TaxID=2893403 RepID=UPI002033C498|nr:amidohydrolase family protein [Streptomyces sp. RKAG293]MCM2422804.1 amidohydrolase family protein [Streptomyces sp. RKAG293]
MALALRCARMFDVEAGEVLTDRIVLVEGERITAVRPAAAGVPEGVEVIDLGDASLSPGLVDLHTHLIGIAACGDPAQEIKQSAAQQAFESIGHARDTLLAGFTTVRDLGTYRAFIDTALRDAIDNGTVIGPRMAVAGAYVTASTGGGMITGLAHDVQLPREFRFGSVRGVDDTRERVREILHGGADVIKLIGTGAVMAAGTVPGAPELTEAQVRAAVEEASYYGAHVAVHAHGTEGINRAVRAGVRSIEHGCYLDDEGIELMLRHGTYLSADIWWSDWLAENADAAGFDKETQAKNDHATEAQREAFTKAVRAGVKIGFGSDAGAFPHGLQTRQLATLCAYGMTPLGALRAATLTSAECMGWEDRIGSIAPGKYADLIAVPGTSGDMAAFTDVRFVMKGGQVVRNELTAGR